MRTKIIVGNWKMNLGAPSEAAAFAKELSNINSPATVVFCVPFTALSSVYDVIKDTNILLGAQNMHYEKSGAYTGEISAQMLISTGCKYVILGHSERREYFGETNELVNTKTKAAIDAGLLPIICVGESLPEREQGITIDLVRLQVKIAFNGISEANALKCVVAYEPIWAIGTGKTATSAQAEEVCKAIRDCLAEIYNSDIAEQIPVQYGGSVNAGNAKELFSQPNIDGGLVGGASLKPEFAEIISAMKRG